MTGGASRPCDPRPERTHHTARRAGAKPRLVIELGESGPTGHLRDALAARLDDPDLVIGYPVDGEGRFVDAMAQEVALPAPHGRTTTTLRYGGADLAVLIHRPGLLDSPEAVDDLVSAIRLGLENERLQAEVLRQLTDIRSSGARILATGDDERRRLERDLHDGAQQRLVGLALGLRLLRSQLRSSEPKLDRAEQELQEAIAELRQLARGLYPAVLTDQGLPTALNALAESRHVRVESLPSGRLPAVVESTAYLLVARAVHSGRTTIESTFHDGALVMDVTVQAKAIDLGEVPDRVKTLGGALDVSRLQSGATLAELRLPVEHAART